VPRVKEMRGGGGRKGARERESERERERERVGGRRNSERANPKPES